MTVGKYAATAAVVAVAWGRPAAAQQTGAAGAPLTLQDAVREALDRNLTLIAERYSISIADARIVTAGLRPNPVFTYNAMVPDSKIYDANVNPLEHVFRADVALERPVKRQERLEVAQASKSVAELQLLNTTRTLVLDVESAFVDVLLAQSNVALARASLEAFDQVVSVNTERVRTGDLSQVELQRSRLAALQFANDVRQQTSKLVLARNHLKTLLGRAGAELPDATGDLRRDAGPPDLIAISDQALSRRPDLQALRQDQARSTAELRLQIAEGKVDYTVSGEVHVQRAPNDIRGNEYGMYVSVPLPLFNRNQGEIARAREERRQLEARVKSLEEEVRSEVRAAYERYQSSRDILAAIEGDMLNQAREVRATTEYSYRRGEASFVEFLDAVRAFNDTMQSYNEARGEYARSLYELDAASGQVMP